MRRFSMNSAALIESARVGADSLRTNPTRTTLSTTGVIIGVAALVYIQAAHPTGGWTLGILAYTVVALLVVELLGRPPEQVDLHAPGPPTPA